MRKLISLLISALLTVSCIGDEVRVYPDTKELSYVSVTATDKSKIEYSFLKGGKGQIYSYEQDNFLVKYDSDGQPSYIEIGGVKFTMIKRAKGFLPTVRVVDLKENLDLDVTINTDEDGKNTITYKGKNKKLVVNNTTPYNADVDFFVSEKIETLLSDALDAANEAYLEGFVYYKLYNK